MPELPEVEAVKLVLEPQLRGLKINDTVIRRQEVIVYPDADKFCERVSGHIIDAMKRRGKFLIIMLENGDKLIVHLRMTGCLLVTPADAPEEKHTHLIFRLSNGKELRFSDTRRFGRFWLIRRDEDDIYSGIKKIGIEPFDPGLSAEYMIACFGKRKKTVKECLLEQSVVAGIGNIYSDEILFAAGIHPARHANSLTAEEWAGLSRVIPKQLSYFIEKNKMTPGEYLESKGRGYRNTPFLQVYGRAGEPCRICGQSLCRMTIGGRSSTFCSVCQKNRETG